MCVFKRRKTMSWQFLLFRLCVYVLCLTSVKGSDMYIVNDSVCVCVCVCV